jgi:hypothetical protein
MSLYTPRLRQAARSQDGFSLIITLGVMLITSLLLVAAFTADGTDVSLSHEDLTQKQAYNAAVAGVQNYEYRLQVNPDFWETCESIKAKLPQEGSSSYEVKLLPAGTASKGATCNIGNPFEYAIQSSGRAANTFNVESTGYAGKDKRSLIATFGVNGFLDYIYFTHYEDQDPELHKYSLAECAQFHTKRVEEARTRGHGECGGNIEFAPEDAVKGPMHTDDAALVCGSAEFGRKGHVPVDKVEINGGIYSEGCTPEPVFNPSVPPKGYTVGEELIPPESDSSLEAYVESGYEFEGATILELEGKYAWVTNAHYEGGARTKILLPKNGLIYVKSTSSPACTFEFEQEPADTSAEVKEEVPCGTVYLKGNYAEALTIAAQNDIVIKGNVTPTGVTPPASGGEPSTPANTVTLGLIAKGYVRMWHPCTRSGEEGLKDPWIYAAILSTSNSFLVDNYACGNSLGNLNIFGAIAQNFRGIVGTSGNTGYIKNYNYDGRLATDEPPYFLAPLKAGWKVTRVTAPSGG